MKKTLLTALIGASVTTAPLAGEWAKLSYTVPTDISNAAATIEPPALTDAQAQSIADQIFINSNTHELAVLSPKEMAETEGAWLPLAFAAWTLGAGAISAWTNHIKHQYNHGEWASTNSTLFATGVGMAGGMHGKAIIKAASLTGWQAVKVSVGGAAISSVGAYGNPFNEKATPKPYREDVISNSFRQNSYEDK